MPQAPQHRELAVEKRHRFREVALADVAAGPKNARWNAEANCRSGVRKRLSDGRADGLLSARPLRRRRRLRQSRMFAIRVGPRKSDSDLGYGDGYGNVLGKPRGDSASTEFRGARHKLSAYEGRTGARIV